MLCNEQFFTCATINGKREKVLVSKVNFEKYLSRIKNVKNYWALGDV